MINKEPNIHVGIVERESEVKGAFNGAYELPTTIRLQGAFSVRVTDGRIVLFDSEGVEVMKAPQILCRPLGAATFTLNDVTIGIRFHWERKEDQTFSGSLRLIAGPGGTITAVNDIGVEEYLKSVISSEMSAEAPEELLRAHAITSRSWLVAMLEREQRVSASGAPAMRSRESANEIVRWYDREDHSLFDVCADDHCQRYRASRRSLQQKPARRSRIRGGRSSSMARRSATPGSTKPAVAGRITSRMSGRIRRCRICSRFPIRSVRILQS
jgi:stage II sporulation protein D